MKRILFIVIGIIILVVTAVAVLRFTKKDDSPGSQIEAPHFVDSTPLHNDVYAAQPINVTVNFNFDVGNGSHISVTDNGGQEWAEGNVLIEDAHTALKRKVRVGLPDGSYVVHYTACWADGSCHDGRFTFTIDSTRKTTYKDLRNKPEVSIDMRNIRFADDKVIISPGTKVTWLNQDDVNHTVNTDTHPEHTYYPEQNSRELSQGQTYSQTFTALGQYNYHCTPHAGIMTASLIVAE